VFPPPRRYPPPSPYPPPPAFPPSRYPPPAAFRPGEPRPVWLTPTPGERAAFRKALRGAAASAAMIDKSLVDRSPVPVLVPDIPGLKAEIALVPDAYPDAYAVTMERPGQSLVIIGSAKAYEPPQDAPEEEPESGAFLGDLATVLAWRAAHPGAPAPNPDALPRNVRFAVTEYGLDVSFSQFGAPYDLTLICSGAGDDPACSSQAAMVILVRLKAVGGGRAW
jgi:hypothetical protein